MKNKEQILRKLLVAYGNVMDKAYPASEKQPRYCQCIRKLSATKSASEIAAMLPEVGKILTAEEYAAFRNNRLARQAVSFAERWALDFRWRDMTLPIGSLWVLPSRRSDYDFCPRLFMRVMHTVGGMQMFQLIAYDWSGFWKGFPEIILAAAPEYCIILKFATHRPTGKIYGAFPHLAMTPQRKQTLEDKTRRLRAYYRELIQPESSDDLSLEDMAGKWSAVFDAETEMPLDLCLFRNERRLLKTFFGLQEMVRIARIRSRICRPYRISERVVLGVVRHNVRFIYVQLPGWDIELPVAEGIYLKTVSDFKRFRRIDGKK